jgi:hypothetical protein
VYFGFTFEARVVSTITNCDNRYRVFVANWAFRFLQNQMAKVGNVHRRYFDAGPLLRIGQCTVGSESRCALLSMESNKISVYSVS